MFKGIISVALLVSCSVALAKPKTSSKPKEAAEPVGKSSCLITAQQAADAICRINDCKDLEMVYEGMEAGAEKFGDTKGYINIRAVSGNGETVCIITRFTYNPKH
ncbi:hypothetical protein D3C87_1571330 [compost metagenome]